MEVTELQYNDTLKYAFTDENIQQFYGSLPENSNAIKTFVKKLLTVFASIAFANK
jgi:hypothetical protein